MKKRKRKKKGRITSARQGRRISLRVASHLYFNNLKKNSGPYLFCTVASMMQCQHPCTANRSTVTLQLVTSQIMIPANYSDDDVHVVGMEGLASLCTTPTPRHAQHTRLALLQFKCPHQRPADGTLSSRHVTYAQYVPTSTSSRTMAVVLLSTTKRTESAVLHARCGGDDDEAAGARRPDGQLAPRGAVDRNVPPQPAPVSAVVTKALFR